MPKRPRDQTWMCTAEIVEKKSIYRPARPPRWSQWSRCPGTRSAGRTPAGDVLLAGDAAWHGVQVEHLRPKASYPGMLADADRAATFGSLHRLHAILEIVRVAPTHDHDAALALNPATDAAWSRAHENVEH